MVDGGRYGAAATVRDCIYGIGPVGGFKVMGGRVCDQHQNILKVMRSLIFQSCNIFS